MNLNLHNKKAKIVAFLLFVSCFVMQAQRVSLSGKVVDNENQPMIGATITIKEIKSATATDVDGNFKLNVPKGTHNLKVSYVGFKTVQREVNAASKNIVIKLTPSKNVLDEVLVSAIRAKGHAPVTYSNLNKEEISKRNLGQDIPQLLNYLPSVVSSSDAGAGVGYTYLRVRGSDETRINVTINGIPYNDAESQGVFWVNIGDFASSTESLQLQRGVGTSTNGAGAFGASLNLLTDNISEVPQGEISNSFGSFGTRKHTVKFSTGKLNDHFEFAGRLSNIYSDGYIDRAFTDLKSYFLQGSYTDDNTLIKALVFGGTEQTYQAWNGLTREQLEEDRRQNVLTYENETDNYQQDHYQLHWNQKLTDNLTTNIGLNYTKGGGFFEQFREDEDAEDFNNLIVDGSDVIVRRWLDNDFYVINANATYTKDKLEVISGFSYSKYLNDHFGEVIFGSELAEGTNIRDRYYFSETEKDDISSFVKANYKITETLTGYADIQTRIVSYSAQGLTSDRDPIDVDKTFEFFNPKLGLSFNLNNQNNFYASYSRANREPNRNDFEGGNSQHETLDDFELGWRFKNDKIKVNANGYYFNYKNQLVLSGAIDDVGAPIRVTSGESYRVGLEIDADIKLHGNYLSVRPNIALSRSRNKDFNTILGGVPVNIGDTPISNSPDVVIGNALIARPISNLEISFLSKYVGKQYLGNLGGIVSNLEKLDRYFTSDLNVTYEIKTRKVFKSIVLSGLINNIFDYKYVDRGFYFTFDDDFSEPGVVTTVDGAGFYPQAPINFILGATFKF